MIPNALRASKDDDGGVGDSAPGAGALTRLESLSTVVAEEP
jgi:hypothetical protein